MPSRVGGTRGLSWWRRVKLEVTGDYPGAIDKLPGCGCIDWLKRLSERWHGWVNRGGFEWSKLDR